MRIGKVSGPYLILILIVIAAAFFAMLRPFLVSILLAAILAGLIYPVFNWMRRRIWNQPTFCSIICVVLVLLLIILPLISVLGLLTVQALQLKDTVDDRLKQVMEKGPGWLERLKRHPLAEKIDIEEFNCSDVAGRGGSPRRTHAAPPQGCGGGRCEVREGLRGSFRDPQCFVERIRRFHGRDNTPRVCYLPSGANPKSIFVSYQLPTP